MHIGTLQACLLCVTLYIRPAQAALLGNALRRPLRGGENDDGNNGHTGLLSDEIVSVAHQRGISSMRLRHFDDCML